MDEEILARLARIEGRLDALESRSYRLTPPSAPVEPPAFSSAALSAPDLETEIGTRWLPRAGAAAVIGAIAYLIGLGLQRGVITPAMLAAGIAVACVLVAWVGTRLRGPREPYGNVLVGLASGGLYVDAVGAHLYQNLLTGEAAVALCTAVSLGTLAFGARRGLPAMLGAGLFGGLIAALMPLTKGAVATSAGLFLLASMPTFTVAGLRRWTVATMASWSAAVVAALPIAFADAPLAVRLLPLDAALLMALAAWGFAQERLEGPDPLGAFPFLAVLVSGGVALAVLNGVNGVAHTAALGLAAVAIGLALRSREGGTRTIQAGLTLALVVAPLGAHFFRVPLLLAALALVETVAFRRRLAPIVVAQTLLAIGSFFLLLLMRLSEQGSNATVEGETALLGLLASASLAAEWAVDRPEARVVAGVALAALATRLSILDSGLSPSLAVTLAWIATFAVALTAGFVRRRPELRGLGLAVAALTAAKVVFVDLAGLDAAAKACILLVFGVVLLGGGYAYVKGMDRVEGEATPKP